MGALSRSRELQMLFGWSARSWRFGGRIRCYGNATGLSQRSLRRVAPRFEQHGQSRRKNCGGVAHPGPSRWSTPGRLAARPRVGGPLARNPEPSPPSACLDTPIGSSALHRPENCLHPALENGRTALWAPGCAPQFDICSAVAAPPADRNLTGRFAQEWGLHRGSSDRAPERPAQSFPLLR